MTAVSPQAATLVETHPDWSPIWSPISIRSHSDTISSAYAPTPTWTEAHWSFFFQDRVSQGGGGAHL